MLLPFTSGEASVTLPYARFTTPGLLLSIMISKLSYFLIESELRLSVYWKNLGC